MLNSVRCLAVLICLDMVNADGFEQVPAASTPSAERNDVVKKNEVVGQGDFVDLRTVELTCGRRALFVLLKLLAADVTYGEVSVKVPVGENGTTLAELEQGSRHWITSLKAISATGESLSEVPLPAIAHGYQDGDSKLGHYVVLLHLSSSKVIISDPSTNKVQELSRSEFDRYRSGYMLAPTGRAYHWSVSLGLLLLLAIVVAVVRVNFSYKFFRRGSNRVRCSVLLFGLVLGCDSIRFIDDSANAQNMSPVRVSAGKLDLGVIAFGEEAFAEFTMSNVSSEPVKLSVEEASCKCLAGGSVPKLVQTLDDQTS